MAATLTIDLDAIAANWRILAARHAAPTAAVVKADAYGLGAPRIALRLFEEGVRHFFVAHPEEGVILRPLLPKAMIGILNGLVAGDAGFYTAHELTPVLGSLADLRAWQAHARHLGRDLPALLHIDTGMHRLGLAPDERASLAAKPDLLSGIDIRYVMTHLTNAEVPDDPRNRLQLERFHAARALLPPAPASIANSSGIFLGDAFRSDLARPGAALYGVNPTPGLPNPMRPVLRIEAPVLQIRTIAAGEPVGYNALWVASRPTRVATVSFGYADGYPRALSNRAQADFDGNRLPLIGRVSMDLITFDATDHPGVEPGCALELIGPAVPPDEVAIWAGTNAYEVLTNLGPRMTRIYAPL